MSEPAGFRNTLIEAVDYGLMVLGEIVRQTIHGNPKDQQLKTNNYSDRDSIALAYLRFRFS